MKSRLLILMIPALSLGCGSAIREQAVKGSTGCDPGTALILVQDAAMVRHCGCSETSGTVVPNDQSFQCTVSSNAMVTFQYVGIGRPRQILLTKGTTTLATPPGKPTKEIPTITHAIKFDQSGTYTLTDPYQSTVNGRIIVQ